MSTIQLVLILIGLILLAIAAFEPLAGFNSRINLFPAGVFFLALTLLIH